MVSMESSGFLIKTNGETVLVFAQKHDDYSKWVREYGIRLKNTYYIHVTSEEDFKGKGQKNHYLLFLKDWDKNKENEPLKRKASRFKAVSRDKFETLLSGLPDNDRL